MSTITPVRAAVRLPQSAAEAQALIEAHIDTKPYTGNCIGCGKPAPCPSRDLAHAAFRRLGELPRRRTTQRLALRRAT